MGQTAMFRNYRQSNSGDQRHDSVERTAHAYAKCGGGWPGGSSATRVKSVDGHGDDVRTFWVRCCLDDMLQSHVRYVIDVDLILQYDDKCLAVELDGEDGGGKEEFADHALSL